MTLSELDAYLRAFTPSEQRYLRGEHTHTFDYLETKKINGEDIKIMTLESSRLNSNAEQISLKKHSRFQECPSHIHTWIEINYIYSGVIPQMINHTHYTLEKGQLILIDSEAPHAIGRVGENDIMLSLLIEKEYLTSVFFNRLSKDSFLSRFFINAIAEDASHNNFVIFNSQNSRRLPIFFNELLCEFFDPSISSKDMINSLFMLIIGELINIYNTYHTPEHTQHSHRTIVPILHYINANYMTCTLEETANYFNLNANYLTTLLKKHTGSSFKELVVDQRLTQAALYLKNSDLTIVEIADIVGYENMSFFYRKFKSKYGCTPKAYRN